LGGSMMLYSTTQPPNHPTTHSVARPHRIG
jgi:hypothetical protein